MPILLLVDMTFQHGQQPQRRTIATRFAQLGYLAFEITNPERALQLLEQDFHPRAAILILNKVKMTN